MSDLRQFELSALLDILNFELGTRDMRAKNLDEDLEDGFLVIQFIKIVTEEPTITGHSRKDGETSIQDPKLVEENQAIIRNWVSKHKYPRNVSIQTHKDMSILAIRIVTRIVCELSNETWGGESDNIAAKQILLSFGLPIFPYGVIWSLGLGEISLFFAYTIIRQFGRKRHSRKRTLESDVTVSENPESYKKIIILSSRDIAKESVNTSTSFEGLPSVQPAQLLGDMEDEHKIVEDDSASVDEHDVDYMRLSIRKHLSHISLTDEKMRGALRNFINADKTPQVFSVSDAISVLNHVQEPLHNLKLQNKELSRADLSGANLHRANLSGAVLTNANLRDSFLENANFAGANMENVEFGICRRKNCSSKIQSIMHLAGSQVVVTTGKNNIIWDFDTEVEQEFYRGGEVKVVTLGKTKEGNDAILYVDESNKISLWNVKEHKKIITSGTVSGIITSLAFWQDEQGNSIVFFIVNDTQIGWWDLSSSSMEFGKSQSTWAWGKIVPLKEKSTPTFIIGAKDGTILEFVHNQEEPKIIYQYANKDFLSIVPLRAENNKFLVTHKSAVDIVEYNGEWRILQRISSMDYNFHQAVSISHPVIGEYILTSDTERVGTLRDFKGNKVEKYHGFTKPTTGVCIVGNDEDEQLTIIVGDESGLLCVWKSNPRGQTKEYTPFSGTVNSISIRHPQGSGSTTVLCGSKDGSIQIRDSSNGRLIYRTHESMDAVQIVDTGLCMGKQVIAAGDSKGFTQIWNADNFDSIRTLSSSKHKIVYLLFVKVDGNDMLAILDERGNLSLWDLESETAVVSANAKCGRAIELIDASQDGDCILYALGGNLTRLLVTKETIEVSDAIELPITATSGCLFRNAQSPDEGVMVIGSDDGIIYGYSVSEGFDEAKWELLDDSMDAKPYCVLVVALYGVDYITSGYDSGDIIVWNVENQQAVCRFQAHRMGVVSVSGHTQATGELLLATASRDHTYHTWVISREEGKETAGGAGDGEDEEGRKVFTHTLLNSPFPLLSTSGANLADSLNLNPKTRGLLESLL